MCDPSLISSMKKLPRTFFARDTVTVARDLLGKYLVHSVEGVVRIGRIVETEAYLGPLDLAAHTARGRTARTEVMFGPPGYAYVYLIYGMYHCMNVTTEPVDSGTAVLIRALEPIQHIEDKTRGPGLLCRAMQIDRSLSGHDMQSAEFHFARPTEEAPIAIVTRPRIGVDYAGEWAARPLRYYIEGNPFISKK